MSLQNRVTRCGTGPPAICRHPSGCLPTISGLISSGSLIDSCCVGQNAEKESEEISVAFMIIQRLFAIDAALNVAKLLKPIIWP
ncbi:hypothetical protein F3I52_13375 [Pantoea sp. M_8]|nr:hypothetical protein F3I51_14075 [Pantoea sp. M_6]KAA5976498.1 hypothetical protein F3I52_13375 [Pantoea sp. M_8]KAA5987784.1 hypothetical protein F3I47_19315 [Pantoea sp. M_10]KAA6001357.1 hypothetical protein F3I50_03095 [Pantoea sp. M_5]